VTPRRAGDLHRLRVPPRRQRVYAERAFVLFMASLRRGPSAWWCWALQPKPGRWNYRLSRRREYVACALPSLLDAPRALAALVRSLGGSGGALDGVDVVWPWGPTSSRSPSSPCPARRRRCPGRGRLPRYVRPPSERRWTHRPPGCWRRLPAAGAPLPTVVVGPTWRSLRRAPRLLASRLVVREQDIVDDSAAPGAPLRPARCDPLGRSHRREKNPSCWRNCWPTCAPPTRAGSCVCGEGAAGGAGERGGAGAGRARRPARYVPVIAA